MGHHSLERVHRSQERVHRSLGMGTIYIRRIAAVEDHRSLGCMRHGYLAVAGLAVARTTEGWASQVARGGVPRTIVADCPGC